MNKNNIFIIKIISLLIIIKISNKHFSYNNNISDKYYNLSEFFFNKSEINDIHFYLRDLTYSFSFKYNMVEIRYKIQFYDENRELIKPFDLTLFYNLNIICHMKDSRNKAFNSLADIYQNKHFLCTHYFHLKDTVKKRLKFGVQIVLAKTNYNYIYFFDYHLIKYKNKEENNTIFNPLVVENEYLKFKKPDNNQYYGLKQFYIDKPNNIDIIQKDNIWTFKNFYNNYFCFCKGLCEYEYLEQFCKYLFYLYIIDKNKNMYNKTDYFLSDFFYTTSDDAFPIFKEMLKLKLNVHYIDSKKEIYEQFCKNDKKCTKIIPIFNGFIDGDFLERYLDIILKLKIIIAGHELKSFYNIFFYMKEITYINLGHGIKYFKHFLYNNYTSCKKFNKLVLPPSKKIISIAKRYGWSQENIIQNCLPKWDRYNNYQSNMISDFNKNEKNKSIFIMFTWRNFLNESYNISPYYLNNVINLINNEDLYKSLVTKNLTLFFTFHPNFQNYKTNIKLNKYVKYIKDKDISDCLQKANLLVTDFSSIIFDMIYQRKPFVLFIPDVYDCNIQNIYEKGYYDIINNFRNGNINFKNVYLNLKDAIKKIQYYIDINFTLESEMEDFYDSFELKCKNNTYSLINYLIHEL